MSYGVSHLGAACGLVLAIGCAGSRIPSGSFAPEPAGADVARRDFVNPGGMWLPQQLSLPAHQDALRKLGWRLDPKALTDPFVAPLNAVISIGGCTAAFVSNEGLIATNHHCVADALAARSGEAPRDLFEHGFLAPTRADELPVPGVHAFIEYAFTDVTALVRDTLPKIADPGARALHVARRVRVLENECSQRDPRVRCYVGSYFDGALYVLSEHLELRDLRLVYAPARAVGDYGGEPDNWSWPRHAGDWAFYRAYVARGGRPTWFLPASVPFRPKHHVQVSTAGVRAGDLVLAAGYPGVTFRTTTAATTRRLAASLPSWVARLRARYELADARARDAGTHSPKAAVWKKEIQNTLEKAELLLASLTSGDVLARKETLDQRIRAWIAQPGHELHQQALARLDRLDHLAASTARADAHRAAVLGSSQLLVFALDVARWAEQREKSDDARRSGYQDRDFWSVQRRHANFELRYDRARDRAMLRSESIRALALPAEQRSWLAALLGVDPGDPIDEATVDRTLDLWYREVSLEDDKTRASLLRNATAAELQRSTDPFIQAALRLLPFLDAELRNAHAREGEQLMAAPWYADAMRHVQGGPLAPDANYTLRVTYGTIKGLPADAGERTKGPFSVAREILARNTGKLPFDAPAKLLAAIAARTYGPYADPVLGGELPVNVLSDIDITSGNSGSPLLNSRGELVGLVFDSTPEGIESDVMFVPGRPRAIAVDARYMIWTMDLLDGGDRLIREMGLTPRL